MTTFFTVLHKVNTKEAIEAAHEIDNFCKAVANGEVKFGKLPMHQLAIMIAYIVSKEKQD